MYLLCKRFFDFGLSMIGLFFLTPLFLFLVLLLRLTGEGQIFYLQVRMGYKNKSFGILKFATMLKDSVNIGSGMVTVRNDPRITPLGGFLRKFKINELPQLWNVLTGDMSFVGPRPLPMSSVVKFEEDVQKLLYQNRPGITGIGSLIFRDEEKLVTAAKNKGLEPLEYYRNHIYPYKGALELWYHKHISFTTDLAILLLTLWSVIYKDSAFVYKVFPSLPPKPTSLTIEGISDLDH